MPQWLTILFATTILLAIAVRPPDPFRSKCGVSMQFSTNFPAADRNGHPHRIDRLKSGYGRFLGWFVRGGK
jgi:hypothetical protein